MQYKYHLLSWRIPAVLLAALIVIPFAVLLFSLHVENYGAIPALWFEDFAFNSYVLIAGTSVVALLFGVPSAWLVATKQFKGRKLFQAMLVLPLAIPAYIQAYTYKGLLDPFGTTAKFFDFYLEVDNIWYLMLFMGSVLYPYVYITARTAFMNHSQSLQEAAASLGASKTRTFFKVILPLARPAIFGGLILVIMEVLNNYGAVSYYGIKTFTTEVIRLWNPMDLQPVLKVAAAVLILVFGLIYLEQFFRKKARYSDEGGKKLSNFRTPLAGWDGVLAIFAIGLPLLIGFIIPIVQLIYWASLVYQDVLTNEFWILLLNTFKMALISSVACVGVAVILHFAYRWNKSRFIQFFARLSTLGYAIPGAVIGVGVLLPIAMINHRFDILLTGSLATLVFAYLVRFQAVSYNAVGAGFDKQSPHLSEAARSLGTNSWDGFRKIIFPLIKPAVLSALVLVFVDVTKELPLTMLFQTFNFETLSVRAFVLMETDGAVYDSSVPSLIIVLIGLVPAILLNQLSKR